MLVLAPGLLIAAEAPVPQAPGPRGGRKQQGHAGPCAEERRMLRAPALQLHSVMVQVLVPGPGTPTRRRVTTPAAYPAGRPSRR